jgi:type II secretory pathway pseudopilin PulG
VIAGVFSVYAVMDMLKYNRKRREDFMQAQKRIEHDALASARLAFLNGSATDEQTRLVEEAIREADRTGQRLPPLLSGPATQEQKDKSQSIWDQVDAQVKAQQTGVSPAQAEELRNKVKGAFEQEKASQGKGGPLDQLGAGAGAGAAKPESSGKSWWKVW